MNRPCPAVLCLFAAGMFGVKLLYEEVRSNWKKSWTNILKNSLTWNYSYGKDEFLLKMYGKKYIFLKKPKQFITKTFSSYVWPWAKKSALQHDSYWCYKFKGSVPFPTERLKREPLNYVGSVRPEQLFLSKKCPPKCRKYSHWKLC